MRMRWIRGRTFVKVGDRWLAKHGHIESDILEIWIVNMSGEGKCLKIARKYSDGSWHLLTAWYATGDFIFLKKVGHEPTTMKLTEGESA